MNFSIVRKNGGTIVWEKSQVDYIIQEYLLGESLKKLSSDFNCSPGTIRNLLRKHNIPLVGNKRGYPRDSSYFSKIDSAEKAYWLGFLYADGSVSKSNNEISITLKDLEHLEKFKEAISATAHKIQKIEDDRFQKKCIYYHFAIKDAKLHDDLIKLGCVPNKTTLLVSFPNIDDKYISHFIRGYFDGDGSLHWLKGNENYRIAFNGTLEFLNRIKEALGVSNLSVGRDRDRNIHYLQISGKHKVVSILNFLYKDSNPEIVLNRKYDSYLKCLEWAHHH